MSQKLQVVKKYPHGTFSWADLASTDQDAAKAFYTGIFGWEIRDVPIGPDAVYTMFEIEGNTVAACSSMQPAQQEQGMPSHWTSYVTVDDVEAVTKKAGAAGGTIIAPPFDVMGEGKMSVIQDPTEAIFALWQPMNHIGAGLVNTPGAISWNELRTRDVKKAGAFYTEVLGWETQEDDGPNPYTMFVNGGRFNGGMVQIDDSWGPVPPHWTPYFSTADIDATLEKVTEMGGTVMFPPVEIPAGRFSQVMDPTGGAFVMIQNAQVDEVPDSWM